jgi:hypothetical protein
MWHDPLGITISATPFKSNVPDPFFCDPKLALEAQRICAFYPEAQTKMLPYDLLGTQERGISSNEEFLKKHFHGSSRVFAHTGGHERFRNLMISFVILLLTGELVQVTHPR